MSVEHKEGEACAGGRAVWSGEGGKRSQTKAPGHKGRTWEARFMAPAHLVEKTVRVELVLVRVGVHLGVTCGKRKMTAAEQRVDASPCPGASRSAVGGQRHVETCVHTMSRRVR